MPTKPEKTPEQLAFEAAQATIRACVMAEDRTTFFTWLRNGTVIRQTSDNCGSLSQRAYTLADFNAILEQHGITGLAPKGAPKHPEKLERQMT